MVKDVIGNAEGEEPRTLEGAWEDIEEIKDDDTKEREERRPGGMGQSHGVSW